MFIFFCQIESFYIWLDFPEIYLVDWFSFLFDWLIVNRGWNGWTLFVYLRGYNSILYQIILCLYIFETFIFFDWSIFSLREAFIFLRLRKYFLFNKVYIFKACSSSRWVISFLTWIQSLITNFFIQNFAIVSIFSVCLFNFISFFHFIF